MSRLSLALGVILLLGLGGICTIVGVAQEPPLTNAEIIKLTKLDLGDAVIIARIKAAKTVEFDTSTDELGRLLKAGVSKAVIAAMIERSGKPADSAAYLRVRLRSTEGDVDLEPMYGVLETQQSPFSVQSWLRFVGLRARVRVADQRPTILLPLDRDPQGAWWFVKLDTVKDEGYRFFDLVGGGGFAFRFSPTPEKGAIVQCEVAKEQAGLWSMRPQKDLKPGEYGLYTGAEQAAAFIVRTSPGAIIQSPSAAAVSAGGASGVLFEFGIGK